MSIRVFSVSVAILLLIVGIGRTSAQTPPSERVPNASIQDSGLKSLSVLLSGIRKHPMVESKAADVDAARRRIAMKSSLMNPMLMLGVENMPTTSFSFNQSPMTSKMIGVSQDFPFPGKLSTQREIASEDTLTSGSGLSEEVNTLRRDITLAYFELYHLQKAIETNEIHITILDELIPIAESKIATEKATQGEVLNLKLESSDIKTEIIDDETALAMRRADLEEASGVRVDSIQLPKALGLPKFDLSIDQLDSITLLHRPILDGLRAKIDQAGLQYDRADLDKYPDFQVSLQYMQKDPLQSEGIVMRQSDMVSAGINIELPINYNNQRRQALGEAGAMKTMEEAELRATILEIHTSLESNLAKLRGMREQYLLLQREVYPVVLASLETSKANYEYDKATIEEVMRSQLNVHHREHQRYKIEAEYNETLATIEYLTGTSLVQYTSRSDW